MDETIPKLTKEEKDLLKEIVTHWKTKGVWWGRGGMVSGGWGASNLTQSQITASRNLIMHNLIIMRLAPTTWTPTHQLSTSFQFNNSQVSIPLPPSTGDPLAFDLLFKPTWRGMRISFVEEL